MKSNLFYLSYRSRDVLCCAQCHSLINGMCEILIQGSWFKSLRISRFLYGRIPTVSFSILFVRIYLLNIISHCLYEHLFLLHLIMSLTGRNDRVKAEMLINFFVLTSKT